MADLSDRTITSARALSGWSTKLLNSVQLKLVASNHLEPLSKLFNWLNQNSANLLALLLLVWGLGLRAYQPGNTGFGFDQVQIMENAEAITHGQLRLIGPRTGLAAMFTGPLIYYITAGWYLIQPDPYALVLTSLTLAALTGITIWSLSRLYWSNRLALINLSLWAFSPFLLLLDRTPWNPNLMILASALVFLPMVYLAETAKTKTKVIQQPTPWRELLLIGLGSWLGYQAHFSGLILPGMFGLLVVWQFRRWWKPALASVVGLGFSLVPTLIFDLRHDWLNWRGFTSLVFNNEAAVSTNLKDELWRTGYIMAETMGKVIFQENHPLLLLTAGLLIIIAGVFFTWPRLSNSRFVTGSWLGIILVGFSLYHGSKPEYYFLLLVPIAIWLIGVIIDKAFERNLRFPLIGLGLIFNLYSTALTWWEFRSNSGLMIGNQLAATEFIRAESSQQNLGPLIYDLESIESVGLKYLLKDFKVAQAEIQTISSKEDRLPTVQPHLIYPAGNQGLAHFYQDGLVVWLDERALTASTSSFLLTNRYLISYPSSIQLYQVFDHPWAIGNPAYRLLNDTNWLGHLLILTFAQDRPTFETNKRLYELGSSLNHQSNWRKIQTNPALYGSLIKDYLLIWEPDPNLSEANILSNLALIEKIYLQIDQPIQTNK